jgi:ATP-dependent Zn protease
LRWWVTAIALFAANYLLVSLFLPAPTTQRVVIPYTLFKQQVDAANVAAITASGDQIQGRFKQPVSYTAPNTTQADQVTAFSTVQPTFSDPGLEVLLEQQGVVVNATSLDQTTPWWLNLLLGFGPTILLIGGFLWLSNRAGRAAGGGLFGIGRSRAKRYDEANGQSQRITFDDVAGIDDAKEELVEIVDFLRDPKKYTRHNYDEAYLRARVIGAMGGRAAEDIVYGTRTTGAESDMQQATNIVRHMVTRWGMSDQLGPVALAQRSGGFVDPAEADTPMAAGRPYSDDTARLIDAEVRRILDESYAEAARLLRQQRQKLDALAKALLEHETLDEQEILNVTRLRPEPRNGVLPLPVAAFIGNELSTFRRSE